MSGLVNYNSDSDSETEASPVAPAASTATTTSQPATAKKPFQKLIDRSNPGKIVVSLPQSSGSDEPPAKRARTEGKGGGLFSSFRSALPAPKKTAPPAVAKSTASASEGGARAVPFSFFKTSSEAAFSREPVASQPADVDDDYDTAAELGGGPGLKLNLPPPKSQQSGTSNPVDSSTSAEPKPEPEKEVKLVGKPLMFRPLSVARKPAGKKNTVAKPKSIPAAAPPKQPTEPAASKTAGPFAEPPKKKQKVSLFSLGEDAAEPAGEPEPPASTNGYAPMFEDSVTEDAVYSDYASYQPPEAYSQPTSVVSGSQDQSLDAIANDLNLSAAARRELFGRGGSAAAQSATASKVINFNLDQEYRSNEEMRASGELQAPAKAVKGIAPGKHNLRQLVNAVQSQREALEDSFVQNKAKQADASSRYGWR
ncbi:uncharacterized protein PgNI_01300 [Pyricularia grisea]|uniref:Mitotic checkpoint regulator, MAD2B-interacting-domain-containing protein n=1 Tax=Pyricularia grisea TaxID=148305 RepID=A0A6P8BFJ7_PYRGI|nr:uncharacterized protein PgNI_01300 [Pyricularia grisea]TLD15490.1 hypothetical protein PgNI_01300 [Pyricularia grisea]